MSVLFSPVDWIYTSNIYEVNLRQYTPEGTFEAFSREMPRLKDMGVDILWLMPITPISVNKRLGSLGSYYACSDYTTTNPEFGTLEDFRRMVNYAHELGMKVIIDWVANHTGWDHRWTKEHPEFYRRNHEGNFFDAHGWEDVIDLNYDNKELQAAMIGAMQFWVREYGIDGFRCDMAMLVPLEFWREARAELDKSKKLFWLAECEEIVYHEVFDATYTWKFLHRMEAVWRTEYGLNGLDEVLQYYSGMFPPGAIRVYFTSNHDENSHSGSEYERMGVAARVFAVLCCTWEGLPMIYSGQELPNYKRLKFFDKDLIDWPASGPCGLHGFYKAMLELKKRNPAMRANGGSSVTHRLGTHSGDRCFAFTRSAGEHEVLVTLNFSAAPLTIGADELSLNGTWHNIFTDESFDFSAARSIELDAWGYGVYEKK
ncbi:MAG TPA: alpha-amylase family glycosyl hydrolase [Puia sp.]|nr:alpha-amylase family glycosyl hydrolase [Puia sp.]